MPRYKDESPAVRVYTVCDESRYPFFYLSITFNLCICFKLRYSILYIFLIMQIFDCEERSSIRLWQWFDATFFNLRRSWRVSFIILFEIAEDCEQNGSNFNLRSFFVISLGVSQWMQKTVSNSPMFIGSNSVFSAMPGYFLFNEVVILWIWEGRGWGSIWHLWFSGLRKEN